MRNQPTDQLIPRRDTAALMGMSCQTLDRHNRNGSAPASVTIGRRRYYRISAISAWLAHRGLSIDDVRQHRQYVDRNGQALGA